MKKLKKIKSLRKRKNNSNFISNKLSNNKEKDIKLLKNNPKKIIFISIASNELIKVNNEDFLKKIIQEILEKVNYDEGKNLNVLIDENIID